MADFSTGIPNIRVIIREATDENLTVDVPNISVKLEPGAQYNVNVTPNTVRTLRTGSFNSYADFSALANTASYALFAQTLLGTIQSASFAYTASLAYTASTVLGGTENYVPLWSTNTTLSSSILFQSESGILINSTVNHTPEAPDTLGIFAASGSTSYNLISGHGDVDNYLQLNLKNFRTGPSASTDIVATADIGDETSGFVDLGINSSGYVNNGNGIGSPLDAYLYVKDGGDLLIGNQSADKRVVIFTGQGDALNNARVFIDPSGSVGINTAAFDPIAPEALAVTAINDSTYNLIKAVASVDNYIQLNLKNNSNGPSASADLVATADNGTEDTNYVDIGINNSSYGGILGGPNDAYVYSAGNDFYLGAINPGQEVKLFVGDNDTSVATKVILRDTNFHDITGSLTFSDGGVTGSLFGTASWALNAVTSSYLANSDLDTVFYVTQEGSDVNNGKTIGTAFRTIKQACQAANTYIVSASGVPRVSIRVKTGYYEEIAPITVPKNTSILGDDLRTVVIRPTDATKGENLFLMNNATYAWGLRLEGCQIDSLTDPRKGFFFAFAPGAYIVTSPYVQNCTANHAPASKFYVPLDYENGNPEVGNGPGGMIVDDSVLDGYSPLKSMIIDAYTQVAFNGIGICVRGAGYAQLVSFFTNFSHVGVWCIDGGHVSLLNSNTTFGDYGLRTSGKRILVVPNVTTVSTASSSPASSIITAEKSSIQNYMITKLQLSGSYSGSYLNTSSSVYTSTIKDSGILLDSIASDLLGKAPGRTVQFTQGLFKAQDISVGQIYTLPSASGFDKGAIAVFRVNDGLALANDFIKSWQYIREYIINDPDGKFGSFSVETKQKVMDLVDIPINTVSSSVINNEPTLLQEFGSLATSTSHDFSYAGAGVNFLALPSNQGGIGQTDLDIRVFQEDGGRVYHTSGDETGDFYTGQDFVIRQATGVIEGRTFNKAIAARFTPLNLALES
jgi:hypothetical protein